MTYSIVPRIYERSSLVLCDAVLWYFMMGPCEVRFGLGVVYLYLNVLFSERRDVGMYR